MYVHEKFISQDKRIIISKKHHSLCAMPLKPKIRQRRMPKVNETDWTQEKINERMRKEKYTRLLADNFHPGDFYLTLTTGEKMLAEDFKEAVQKFMRSLSRRYKKVTGERLKYFRALENMSRGRPHAHLLIPAFCDSAEIRILMKEIWTLGHVKVEIYGGGAEDAANVAGYFTKESRKETGAKIDTSRGNLIRRKPTKKIVHAETFSDEIKAPKGYRVVKSLSYNTLTQSGYAYQIAVFEKIERGKAYADKKADWIQDKWSKNSAV